MSCESEWWIQALEDRVEEPEWNFAKVTSAHDELFVECDSLETKAKFARMFGDLSRIQGENLAPSFSAPNAVQDELRTFEDARADGAFAVLVGVRPARDRTIAALRRKARAHERLSRMRSLPSMRTQWWDWNLVRYHEGAADALETMADRIERGEA